MSQLESIYKEFQGRLVSFGTLVAAGGAVRDSLLGREPKDYDLFLLWPGEFEFEEAKKQIEPLLSDLARIPPVVEWHNSEPFLVATVDYQGLQVQVLVNPQPTMADLIASFDWNVCLFGYDGTRYFQGEQLENIKAGCDLKLQKVTFPLSTLRRGFRFSERFKMRLLYEDVLSLSQAIIANHKTKNDKGPSGNEPDMKALEANLLVDDDIDF